MLLLLLTFLGVKIMEYFCDLFIASSMPNSDQVTKVRGSSHIPVTAQRSDGSLEDTKAKLERLRRQHQRSHRERRGQYPLDDREESYEQQLRQVSTVSLCLFYELGFTRP